MGKQISKDQARVVSLTSNLSIRIMVMCWEREVARGPELYGLIGRLTIEK